MKPVIDLNDHHHVNAYEVPDRIREQAALINPTCVFPWCTRSARSVATATTSSPTTRAELRPATTSPRCADDTIDSRPTVAGPTRRTRAPAPILWTSPHGYTYLRDQSGTLDVSRDQAATTDRATRPKSLTAPHPADPRSAGHRHVLRVRVASQARRTALRNPLGRGSAGRRWPARCRAAGHDRFNLAVATGSAAGTRTSRGRHGSRPLGAGVTPHQGLGWKSLRKAPSRSSPRSPRTIGS